MVPLNWSDCVEQFGAAGDRRVRRGPAVQARPVERRRPAAVAATEGDDADPQRPGQCRPMAGLADQRPGRAVVAGELARDLRPVVAGAQQHVGRQRVAGRRRDALRDRRVHRSALGHDVLVLPVPVARLDRHDLRERIRVLGLPDHDPGLLAVGVDAAGVQPGGERPFAVRRVLEHGVGRERVVGDEVALEDRHGQVAAADHRAAAGGPQHGPLRNRASCRRTRPSPAGRTAP